MPDLTSISLPQITAAITAVGALGTAAFGLVEASKITPFLTNRGFGNVKGLIEQLAPPDTGSQSNSALTCLEIVATLRADWHSGMSLADQKSVAKTLIKLRMNATTTVPLAKVTGIDAATLSSIATKLASGEPLLPAETDTYGRFDLILSTLIDRVYQKADFVYATTAKVAACIVAIFLAEVASAALGDLKPDAATHHFIYHWSLAKVGLAFVVGLIATPLAPIASDLTSALNTAAKAVQSVKK